MAPKKLNMEKDKTADLLFAISIGFLINFLLGVALPEIGPFIAGLASGVMVKEGPLKGGLAGFIAGTLGGLASLTLWLSTNLFSLPASFIPIAFQYAVIILTAEYAILSLSGGIIGSVLASEHWPNILGLFKRQKLPGFPTFPASPAELENQED